MNRALPMTLLFALACGDPRTSMPESESASASNAASASDAASASASDAASASASDADEPDPDADQPAGPAAPADRSAAIPGAPLLPGSLDDERAALQRIGATRVWRAVIERGEYLARRQRRGAVHGRVGPSVGGYRWLIDESRGSGSLSLRLLVPPGIALEQDQRVVAFGAWHVDADRGWYWQADKLAALPAREWDIPEESRSAPGHVIVDIPDVPEGARPVSGIPHQGGTIVFEVVRAAADPADGWEISDRTGGRATARLFLPGEQESYGGQDLRSPNEHWQLERNTRYTVRIKRYLPAKDGELPNMTALSAPRRIIASAPRAP